MSRVINLTLSFTVNLIDPKLSFQFQLTTKPKPCNTCAPLHYNLKYLLTSLVEGNGQLQPEAIGLITVAVSANYQLAGWWNDYNNNDIITHTTMATLHYTVPFWSLASWMDDRSVVTTVSWLLLTTRRQTPPLLIWSGIFGTRIDVNSLQSLIKVPTQRRSSQLSISALHCQKPCNC